MSFFRTLCPALLLFATLASSPRASAQLVEVPVSAGSSSQGHLHAVQVIDNYLVTSGSRFFTEAPIEQYDVATGAYIRELDPIPAESLANVAGNLLAGQPRPGSDGQANLYDLSTGALLQAFAPPATSPEFGTAVGSVGGDALVSAPDLGAVYRMDPGTGSILVTYAAPSASAKFGTTLLVSGDRLFVGDPGFVDKQPESGAVFVFDATTGALETTLGNPLPREQGSFGRALAEMGSSLFVGAPGPPFPSGGNKGNKDRGVVQRFDAATLAHTGTLTNPSPALELSGLVGQDEFGFSLDVFNDLLLVSPRKQRDLNHDAVRPVVYAYDEEGTLVESVRPEFTNEGLLAQSNVASLDTTESLLVMGLPAYGPNREPTVLLQGPCGNARIDAGEACDDGNLLDGDCCSSTCQLDTTVCDGGLTRKSSVSIRRNADHAKDRFSWKWRSSSLLQPQDLGDPESATDYALCVIDDSTGTPELKLSVLLPAAACPNDTCWRANKKGGFVFRARNLDLDGIRKSTLLPGAANKGKITISGRGPLMALGELPFTGPVKVRLKRTDAPICWESVFDADIAINTDEKFKARAD